MAERNRAATATVSDQQPASAFPPELIKLVMPTPEQAEAARKIDAEFAQWNTPARIIGTIRELCQDARSSVGLMELDSRYPANGCAALMRRFVLEKASLLRKFGPPPPSELDLAPETAANVRRLVDTIERWIDLVEQDVIGAKRNPLAQPSNSPELKKASGESVDEAMHKYIERHPADYLELSLREWKKEIGYSISTIAGCTTWSGIMTMRRKLVLERKERDSTDKRIDKRKVKWQRSDD